MAMGQPHQRKPHLWKKIAEERMHTLFSQAELRFKEDSSLSDRYVKLARILSMKYKVPLPRELKRRYCRKCLRYLSPSQKKVRTKAGKVVISCPYCKHQSRIPLH